MKNRFGLNNYKIGISFIGLAAVVLIMLPNIGYLFYTPPNDVLSSNEAGFWFWNILENIGRFGLMISLCIVINNAEPLKSNITAIVTICSLVAYYLLWLAYFVGVFNGLSLVGMAVFPSMFFLLVSWRQRNIFALIFSFLFAAVHIIVTGNNFLF